MTERKKNFEKDRPLEELRLCKMGLRRERSNCCHLTITCNTARVVFSPGVRSVYPSLTQICGPLKILFGISLSSHKKDTRK